MNNHVPIMILLRIRQSINVMQIPLNKYYFKKLLNWEKKYKNSLIEEIDRWMDKQ